MGSRHIRGPLCYNTHKILLTGDYTVINESLVVVNKTSGAATAVTLPPSVTADGRREVIVVDGKGDSATNAITVTADGSDTINGAATYVMAANYSRARFIDCGGGVWIGGAALDLTSAGGVTLPTSGLIGMSRAAIAAAGADAAAATQITRQVSAVTASDGAKGVALPAASTTIGPLQVINTVSNASLLVYPFSGGNDNINGLAEDLPIEIGGGESVWFIPTSATQWYAAVPHNNFNAEIVTTTNVITPFENGKTFYLSLVGGFTSTLPAPALGLHYKFIVKIAPTTAYIITTTSSANIMYGMMLERAGTAGVAGAARDVFNFVASQAIIGDWVEFKSDGTNWYYHGMVDVAAGNTVAQT